MNIIEKIIFTLILIPVIIVAYYRIRHPNKIIAFSHKCNFYNRDKAHEPTILITRVGGVSFLLMALIIFFQIWL